MAGKPFSIVGAARYAREARIATVHHLREHRIARRLQELQLKRAFEIHRTRVGSHAGAKAMLFGGMGLYPPYPNTWPETTDLVLSTEADAIATADLYVLTPEMLHVAVAAALTLDPDDFALLDVDDLPSPTGIIVLPNPLLVRALGGDMADHRAYTWRTPANFIQRADGHRPQRELPGIRLSTYNDAHGPVQPDSFRQIAAVARNMGEPLPPRS